MNEVDGDPERLVLQRLHHLPQALRVVARDVEAVALVPPAQLPQRRHPSQGCIERMWGTSWKPSRASSITVMSSLARRPFESSWIFPVSPEQGKPGLAGDGWREMD